MKTKMQIINTMYFYDLRTHTGAYTFSFKEDKYFFQYHSHSTGRHLNIFIIAPDGDKMEVYEKTEWFSSQYHFNGFGKGYIQGPWIDEIEELFKKFKREIINHLLTIRKKRKDAKIAAEKAEIERFEKFANLCTKEPK